MYSFDGIIPRNPAIVKQKSVLKCVVACLRNWFMAIIGTFSWKWSGMFTAAITKDDSHCPEVPGEAVNLQLTIGNA